MIQNSTIHARINSELKENAERILDQIGMSSAEAIRLFYKQIELRKGIPFDINIPNKLTEETLNKSNEGIDVHQVNDSEQLFSELDI
ncbi:MAG: type II toxin-antitoxin system RelB/DinJ family antitoxin [Methyloprofundus sp.]